MKVVSVLFLHAPAAQPSTLPNLSQANKVPWLDTSVIIIKAGHPYRGYSAAVKNVLTHQTTPSGLKVQIQLSHLDFTSPFWTLTVDYDDIIEAR